MNPFRKLFETVLVFLLLFGWGPDVSVAAPLKIGIMHFAPFLVVKDGEIGGTELKRLQKVLDLQGIEYTVVGLPPKRLYHSIGIGKIDLILSAKTHPAYEKEVIHSADPITRIDLKIFSHNKMPLPKSQAEWTGKTFIIINGYGYAGLLARLETLEKNRQLILYRNSDHNNAVKMLAAKRADYLLDYKMPASKAISDLGLAGQLQSKTVFKVDIYVLLNRHVKDARRLLETIELGYQQLARP